MNSPTTAASQKSGFDEAFGFGAVEVCCFLALLGSVLFFGGAATNFLVTVVVARGLWLLGAWPAVGSAGTASQRSKRALSFVLVGLAYQIPFWLSLATLPIRGLHQEEIGQALLGQLLILFAAVGIFVLLPWVDLLTLGSFLALGATFCFLASWPPERVVLLLGGAVFFLGRFQEASHRAPLDRKETWCIGGLAAACWVTFLALLQTASFPGEDLVGRLLLPWLLLVFVGSQLFARSRGGDVELENGIDHWSVSGHHLALRSLYIRRSATAICSALLFLAWIPWNLTALATFLLLCLAWDRALALSVARIASPEVVAWWGFLELVFLMAAMLVGEKWIAVVIGASALASVFCGIWTKRRLMGFDGPAAALWLDLKDLSEALKVPAPVSLKERVSREIEIPPQLDTNLTTTAPTGFRDRLLGRLKQRGQDERESQDL